MFRYEYEDLSTWSMSAYSKSRAMGLEIRSVPVKFGEGRFGINSLRDLA